MNDIVDDICVIAEIGSVHDGSLGNALKLISTASECGADVIKFQTHIAEAETLRNAPMPSFFKGEPRYQYFERTAFSFDEWKDLKSECNEKNVEFLSSPFSLEAVEILERLGVFRYKIPSGEVTNIPLLRLIAQTKKPVLLSSGMSSWNELDEAINTIQKVHSNITILQCTSEYPCSYQNVGLNIMVEMKERYQLPVGFSDHTLTNYSAFTAAILGASVIEKHLTFSRMMYGSDAKHSLVPEEFKELVTGVRAIKEILSSRLDKDLNAKNMIEMRDVFQKSIVAVIDIEKGAIITKEMIGFKKPGIGITPNEQYKVIGRISNKIIKRNNLIKLEDLKNA